MRVRKVSVDEGGLTITWGLGGIDLAVVRVAGDAVLVEVKELLRREVVEEVIKESLTCAEDLGACAGRVEARKDISELGDALRDLLLSSDEECVRREDLIEYAVAIGYSEEDAEKVIEELVEEGFAEDRGGCYFVLDDDPFPDP